MCYLTLAGKSPLDAANEVPGDPVVDIWEESLVSSVSGEKEKLSLSIFSMILNLLKL
jgi:hypothetical protein